MLPTNIKIAGMAQIAAKRLFSKLPVGVRKALGQPSNLQKVLTASTQGNVKAKNMATKWLQDFTGSPEAIRRNVMEDSATLLLKRKGIKDTQALEQIYSNMYGIDNSAPPAINWATSGLV